MLTASGLTSSGGIMGCIQIDDFRESFRCWLPRVSAGRMCRMWLHEIEGLIVGESSVAKIQYDPRLYWAIYNVGIEEFVIRNVFSRSGDFKRHAKYRKCMCSEWIVGKRDLIMYVIKS